MTRPRRPYVEGDTEADGARRSADIDRTEADMYPTGSPAWARCLASARHWDDIADALEADARANQPPRRPLLLVTCRCGSPRLPARPCQVCGAMLPPTTRNGLAR